MGTGWLHIVVEACSLLALLLAMGLTVWVSLRARRANAHTEFLLADGRERRAATGGSPSYWDHARRLDGLDVGYVGDLLPGESGWVKRFHVRRDLSGQVYVNQLTRVHRGSREDLEDVEFLVDGEAAKGVLVEVTTEGLVVDRGYFPEFTTWVPWFPFGGRVVPVRLRQRELVPDGFGATPRERGDR